GNERSAEPMKKILIRLVLVALIAGGCYAGYIAIQNLPKDEQTIATVAVRRGDVTVKSYARGELRAVRSATLIAPNLFGTVQAAIDQQKNKLNLEEAKRRLSQLESDVKSRKEQALAELAVMQEKKNKGNLEMTRERARLQQVKLLAPISGLVAIRQNRTGFF